MKHRIATFAVAAALTSAPLIATSAAAPTAQVEVIATRKPAPAAARDRASYAARERHDRDVAHYRGGEVVMFTASAVTVLVVLLIIVILI
jgi:hypothetical protein